MIRSVLSEQYESSKLIIESVREGMYGIDRTGHCVFINRAGADILGYSQDACLGKNMHSLIHHSRAAGLPYPEAECPIFKTRETVEGCTVEDEVFWKADGSSFPVHYTSNPVIRDGQHEGAVITFIDITGQKVKEAEILRLKTNQEYLINATDDLIWSLDTGFCLIACNNAFKRYFRLLTGKEARESESVLIDELGVTQKNKWQAFYKRALAGEQFSERELSYNPFTESMGYQFITFRTMYSGDGTPNGCACYSKDIPEEALNHYALKEANNRLLENERRLKIAQKLAGLAYWHMDFSGSVYWSREVYEIFGLSPQVFLPDATNVYEFVHPEDIHLLDGGPALFGGEHLVEVEFRILRPSGETRWLQVTGSQQHDEINGLPIIEGTVQDITQRKLISLSLEESNQRYRYVTQATFDAVWDWDLEKDVLVWGEGFQNIFGYRLDSIRQDIRSWSDNIHPEDHARVLNTIHACIEGTDHAWSDEYRFKMYSGDYAFVADKGIIIRNEKGRPYRMVGAMQNITRQKLEEQRLKLFESVILHTTEAVLITDVEMNHGGQEKIVFVNEAFCRMSGYAESELIGRTPRILQGPKTDASELRKLSEAISRWEPCEITVLNYRKNGEEFWNSFSITPVADGKDWYSHWIALERDVSKKKNEELQQTLLNRIGHVFNINSDLKSTLTEVLREITQFASLSMAEAWLVSTDENRISLAANYGAERELKVFYRDGTALKDSQKGKGLIGRSWESAKPQIWEARDTGYTFVRGGAALQAGWKTACTLPMIYNGKVIGVLLLAINREEDLRKTFSSFFDSFSIYGAEIRRKQLEAELDKVFSMAPDMIVIASTDGYFKKVSPACMQILGYTEKELMERPYMDFVHPDDKFSTSSEAATLVEGKPTFYFENRYISKSGAIKWLAWTVNPAGDDELMFAVAKDITEKKELEKMLTRAGELAKIGAWELDVQNMELLWSDVTREIHEIESGFMPTVEQAINFYKEGQSRDTMKAIVEKALSHGHNWDVELEIVTARGNSKWVRAMGDTEMLNGSSVRLWGSFQDIDSRKRADLALEAMLAEKDQILESIGDAFFAVDRDWVVTYWNTMAETVLAKNRLDVLGNGLWDLYPDVIDTPFYSNYQEAVATNSPRHFEAHYAAMGVWFEVSAYPSAEGLSVYFRDVSERKNSEIRQLELNKSLQKQTRELAVSNAELEQFAYVASHDLQEPLRMVSSFLTQLEIKYNDVLDDRGRQYISFAVDGAKRMRQIILDLLEFSRVGRTEVQAEQVDFNNLTREIMLLYHRQIEESHALINFNNLPTVFTYKTPLRQVFQNLISNALKYHDKTRPPVISIHCSENKKEYTFAFSDNGIGIDEEYFEKIFIIFKRLHNKDEYAGTGMGLAVTKKIVENLGGKIWLESKEGQGTTFYFTVLKSMR